MEQDIQLLNDGKSARTDAEKAFTKRNPANA